MQLSAAATDALTELLNIAHGRAAAALSEMTGHRIVLDVPSIRVLTVDDLAPHLLRDVGGDVVCVNQAFTGALAGNAMLLLDKASGIALSNLLDRAISATQFDDASREVITETGNVLLSACLGTFGNLLQVQISFTVPWLKVDSVPLLLKTVSCAGRHLTHAVVAQTRFTVQADKVSGMLVVILGLTSLQCLVDGLDRWAES